MSKEQNMLNKQEAPKAVEANQSTTKAEVTEEEKQAKATILKEREIEDGKKIEDLRKKLTGEPKRTDFEMMKEFLKNETNKINEMAEANKGSSDNAIGGRKENFNKTGMINSLEDYHELKFIDHAINEGTKDELNYALRIINSSYRDRDDLKSQLEKKLS